MVDIHVNDADSFQSKTAFTLRSGRIYGSASGGIQDAKAVGNSLHGVNATTGMVPRRARGTKDVDTLSAHNHIHGL
jgi:hypothetical protein